MLCYVRLGYVMLCYAMLCYVMLANEQRGTCTQRPDGRWGSQHNAGCVSSAPVDQLGSQRRASNNDQVWLWRRKWI